MRTENGSGRCGGDDEDGGKYRGAWSVGLTRDYADAPVAGKKGWAGVVAGRAQIRSGSSGERRFEGGGSAERERGR